MADNSVMFSLYRIRSLPEKPAGRVEPVSFDWELGEKRCRYPGSSHHEETEAEPAWEGRELSCRDIQQAPCRKDWRKPHLAEKQKRRRLEPVFS